MSKSKAFNYEVSDKLKAVLQSHGLGNSTVALISAMVELEVIQQYRIYLSERISDESKRS